MQITYRGTAPQKFTIAMAETYDLDFWTAILTRKHRERHLVTANSSFVTVRFNRIAHTPLHTHRCGIEQPRRPDIIYDIS